MTSKNTKILVFVSAIALLAAGCSSASQTSTPTSMNSSSTMANMPGMQPNDTASSTRGGFGMPNIPAGSKAFFGTIASVSGSQITISGRSRSSSSTVSTIIDITGSTQFQDGTQSSLTSGTRVIGYGTANSDGSINATSVNINPAFPTGRGQGSGRYHGSASNQSQSSQ